jgi:methyl-accepting chemotaxis protein
MPVWEAVVLALVVVGFAGAASAVRAMRTKAELTSLGLIACTFVAIELSGGAMSSHIHLYAILIFVALYQQWRPMLFAVLLVVVHHGVLGVIAPERVFGMPMHIGEAMVAVAVHGGLALLEVAGILIFWHFAEESEREIESLAATAEAKHREAVDTEQRITDDAIELERTRATQIPERAARISADAATIGDGARAAIEAVAAVEVELAKLTTAVEDIARRSGQATGTASSGRMSPSPPPKRCTSWSGRCPRSPPSTHSSHSWPDRRTSCRSTPPSKRRGPVRWARASPSSRAR